jgi:predicted Ser/Thr protein kinase
MATATRCLICNAANPAGATTCSTCGAALSGDPAAGAHSALPPGTPLNSGRYAVGKVLGQGGFGITYLGSDSRIRRPLAIKEFFPLGSIRRGTDVQPSSGMGAAEFAEARSKFLDEARVLAQFHHRGIVDVYGGFQEHNTAYMVMEFLRGRSLGDLVAERGALPQREAIGYIERAGEALAVVHEANILHRDIKPDNVMLTDDGRVVLIDFGTARVFAAGMTSRMTTMVTPGYAPLEQYGHQVRFGPFTDIYALAATLYHLLTGQMPTQATDRASGVELRSPHQLNPAVDLAVSAAVMWALEMRVDHRPQRVMEFIDALRPADPAAPPEPKLAPPATEPDEPEPWWPASSAANTLYEVRVADEAVHWPNQCACCFEPADGAYTAEFTGSGGPFGLFQETRAWEVPYCSTCLEHLRAASSPASGGGGLAAAAPLAGLLLGGPLGMLIGLGGAAAVSLLKEAGRQSELQGLLRPTCVAVGPAVGYNGWSDGIHTFVFLNRDFVEAFERDNAVNIVS